MVFYGSDFSVRGYRDKEFQADVLWDVPLLEGYHSEYLRDFEKVDGVGFFLPMWWPAVKRLIAERPDVVVITAYHAAFWYGIVAAAVAMGARIVMRHDATDEAYGSKGIKAAVRSIILRSLYRSVAQFAVVGERARRHLKKYGVGESKMSWSPFCIDSDWLESQRTLWKGQRSGLREKFKIGEKDVVLLFCGKLIKKKDPMILFEALRHMSDKSSLHLVVAGSGPLGSEVERAGRAVLGERFHPLGFLNQKELGQAYALADVFVLPSRKEETWGLVVNEAMQFGLPVVLSDQVGCHEDLVPDEGVGRVFKAGDARDLADALDSLINEFPDSKARYAEACRVRVACYSLDKAVFGLRKSILAAYR